MPHYRQSLSKGLENKVLALVRRYVDDLALSEEQNGGSSGSLRLSVSKLYQYVVADGSVPRQKKQNLEKMIEKAIEVLREEGEDEDEEAEIDSDFEGLNEEGLMEPKNTNSVNKKIVDMWGTKATSTTVESTASTSTTTTSATVLPVPPTSTAPPSPVRKRKERPIKDGESTKRVKSSGSSEDRTPPKNITLKDLGGVDDIINDLLELIAMPLTHPEVYAHTGVSPPRGVLLHGPPGCGKTMLANAMAGELGLPFLSVSAPSIVSGMSGESEKKLRELFEEAREKAPCLVFMDEIDAITPKRESAQREMERRIVAQLLTCMDDLTLEKTGGKVVMVIGATNRPDSLDPALRRAGRFDREICLNVPDEIGREKILRVLSQKLRLSGDFDFAALAKMTPGFVGADLNSLTAEAGTSAMKRIFQTLKTPVTNPSISTLTLEPTQALNPDGMDIDLEHLPPPPAPLTETLPHEENAPVTSIIQSFLKAYPSTLTEAQLEPLTITLPDFLTALPKIQPSSKREGFATVPDVTWADIGALAPIRVEMQMAIVQPIKRPELYASVGITAPTGVLLWGPPGCGKTLLAKAVANESRANFISVRGPELLNKYVGESERAVRQVFSRARASVPCVIFFDELDALVPRRDDSLSESSARVVNTLLTELDGLNDRKGIYVIGATNRPDVIDPAMLRPGRLDKPLFVDLPTPGERVDILRTITKKCPLEGVNLKTLGEDQRCENFSGADLAALVREASVSALRKSCLKDIGSGSEVVSVPVGQVRVTWEDFETAWGGVRPSVTERQRGEYGRLATRFGWGKEKKVEKKKEKDVGGA